MPLIFYLSLVWKYFQIYQKGFFLFRDYKIKLLNIKFDGLIHLYPTVGGSIALAALFVLDHV